MGDKEEREKGEGRERKRREKGKGKGFFPLLFGAAEKNHQKPRVFFDFSRYFLEVLCFNHLFLCVGISIMLIPSFIL